MFTINHHFNTKERPLILTSLLLFIPAYIASLNNQLNIAIMIFAVAFLSTLHHIFKKPGSEWWWHTKGRHPVQTFLLLVEIFSSLILALWGFVILFDKPTFVFISALIVFVPVFILYMHTDYNKYVEYHSVWHVIISFLVSLVLI